MRSWRACTVFLGISFAGALRLPALENCELAGDDDGDLLADCADDECASSPACSEAGHCTDALDNDGDLRIDCADCDCFGEPACVPPVESDCSDGSSDDCDGLIDCLDPDCDRAAACTRPLRRGDATGDGELDVSDAIASLHHLFLGRSVDCRDALDLDDSGALEVTDPIYLLLYLFAHGAPPPAPHPGCGPDATADELDCLESPGCGA